MAFAQCDHGKTMDYQNIAMGSDDIILSIYHLSCCVWNCIGYGVV